MRRNTRRTPLLAGKPRSTSARDLGALSWDNVERLLLDPTRAIHRVLSTSCTSTNGDRPVDEPRSPSGRSSAGGVSNRTKNPSTQHRITRQRLDEVIDDLGPPIPCAVFWRSEAIYAGDEDSRVHVAPIRVRLSSHVVNLCVYQTQPARSGISPAHAARPGSIEATAEQPITIPATRHGPQPLQEPVQFTSKRTDHHCLHLRNAAMERHASSPTGQKRDCHNVALSAGMGMCLVDKGITTTGVEPRSILLARRPARKARKHRKSTVTRKLA